MGLLQPKTSVQAQAKKAVQDTAQEPVQEAAQATRALSASELEQLKTLQDRAAGALAPAAAEWEHSEEFEQEAVIEEHLAEPAASTAVAVRTQNTEVRSAIPAGSNVVHLSEAGFDGLELGSRSFPIISLKTDGVFEDTEGNSYGKEIRVRVINSRRKTAVQGSKTERGKPVEEVFFTYDGVTTSGNKLVSEIIQEWEENGYTIAKREYTDVLCTIDDPESEFDSELRVLSISPTSRERLAGKMTTLQLQNKWNAEDLRENIGDYIMIASVGAKVQKAIQPFWPWSFTFKKA